MTVERLKRIDGPKNKEAPPDRFTPVSETSGTIKTIFVNVRPTDSHLLLTELQVIKAIRAEIPNVKVIVGVGTNPKDDPDIFHFNTFTDQQEKVATKLAELGVTDVEYFLRPFDMRASWARDLGFWANDGKTFVVPGNHPLSKGLRTSIVPFSAEERKTLRDALGIEEVATSHYPFDGGDACFSDDKVFFGYTGAPHPDHQQQLRRNFTNPVVILGDEQVGSPNPHVDLGSIPVSNSAALINDPEEMVDILASLTSHQLDQWQDRFADRVKGRAYVLGANKSLASISSQLIRDISFINSPGKYGHDVIRNSLHRQVDMMSTIKRQLEEQNIQPLSLPGAEILGCPFTPVNSLPDTYMENGQVKRRLFVLTYGLPVLDYIILSRLENSKLFDRIVPIEGGWELNMFGGGLRCVVNALRGPFVVTPNSSPHHA